MSGGCVYRGDTSKSQEWLHHKCSSSPAERSWLYCYLCDDHLQTTNLAMTDEGSQQTGVAAIPGILVRLPGRITSPPMCGQSGQLGSGQTKCNERAQIAGKKWKHKQAGKICGHAGKFTSPPWSVPPDPPGGRATTS
eukprot:gene25799-biopygen4529